MARNFQFVNYESSQLSSSFLEWQPSVAEMAFLFMFAFLDGATSVVEMKEDAEQIIQYKQHLTKFYESYLLNQFPNEVNAHKRASYLNRLLILLEEILLIRIHGFAECSASLMSLGNIQTTGNNKACLMEMYNGKLKQLGGNNRVVPTAILRTGALV